MRSSSIAEGSATQVQMTSMPGTSAIARGDADQCARHGVEAAPACDLRVRLSNPELVALGAKVRSHAGCPLVPRPMNPIRRHQPPLCSSGGRRRRDSNRRGAQIGYAWAGLRAAMTLEKGLTRPRPARRCPSRRERCSAARWRLAACARDRCAPGAPLRAADCRRHPLPYDFNASDLPITGFIARIDPRPDRAHPRRDAADPRADPASRGRH